MTTSLPPAAVLFDMDGTLIDSEPFWHRAQERIFAGFGIPWTEDQSDRLVGQPVAWSAARMIEITGAPMGVDDLVAAMVSGVLRIEEEEGLPWRPGAFELLTALRDARVPCTIVTSSYRSLTGRIVADAPAGVFVDVVSADDVADHKPHPAPYRTGAERVGVPADRCVAIEDSPAGVTAALAAGCRTVAVPNHVDIPAAPGLSYAASLASLDLATLGAIGAGEVLDLR